MLTKIREYDEDDPAQFVSFPVDESFVELFGDIYMISLDQDIYIREGTWFEKNDSGEWEPDWSLTWFYTDEDNPQDYLYFEQDGIEVSLHNFMRMYDG